MPSADTMVQSLKLAWIPRLLSEEETLRTPGGPLPTTYWTNMTDQFFCYLIKM